MRAFGVSVAVFLATAEILLAQNRKVEFFEVTNPTDKPIWVSLRARGGGQRGWQPAVKVEPKERAIITLRGYQPFDVTIRQADKTAYVFDRVKLCTFMEQCSLYGQRDWEVTAREWKGVPVGGRTVDRETGQNAHFVMTADRDSVKMKFLPEFGVEAYHPGTGDTMYPGKTPGPRNPPPGGPRR